MMEIDDQGEPIVTIMSTKKGAAYRVLGQWITRSNGHEDRVVERLPVFGQTFNKV